MSESPCEWQKSSFSTADVNQDCLEVAGGPGGQVYLRESDDPAVVLAATPARLAALLMSCAGRSSAEPPGVA